MSEQSSLCSDLFFSKQIIRRFPVPPLPPNARPAHKLDWKRLCGGSLPPPSFYERMRSNPWRTQPKYRFIAYRHVKSPDFLDRIKSRGDFFYLSCPFPIPFETKTSKKLYNLPERHHRAVRKPIPMTNLQAHLGFVFANKKLRRFKMRLHADDRDTRFVFFCAAHSGKDILSKWFSFYDIDKKRTIYWSLP